MTNTGVNTVYVKWPNTFSYIYIRYRNSLIIAVGE